MMPPKPVSFAPGSRAPGLRIATHNVRGLAATGHKLQQLMYLWGVLLRLDVVCIQETWLTGIGGPARSSPAMVDHALSAAARAVHVPGYTSFWSSYEKPTDTGSRGVGVLIKSSLIASGELEVVGDSLVRDADGRRLALHVKWRGHAITFLVLYMPCDSQTKYIKDTVRPWLHSCCPDGASVVLLGDFNMTFAGSMDCVSGRGAAYSSPRQASAVISDFTDSPARHMLAATAAHDLVDCYRHFHPTARSFSCLHHASCRLLDRIFVSSPLLARVHQCRVDCRTVSDHRPVVLHLRPHTLQTPPPAKTPRQRHTVAFDSHPDLLAAFTAWAAQETAAAPPDAAALLDWWPAFKTRLVHKLRALNAAARARVHGSDASELRAADDALQAAVIAMESAAGTTAASLQQVLAANKRYVAALASHAASPHVRARHRWLHEHERVAHHMRGVLAPSRTRIPPLQCPAGGGLAATPAAAAELLLQHFSGVSAQPACNPSARAAVLRAMRAHATRVDPALAADAAAVAVTPEEVTQACKHMRQDSSPGPDGLPAKVWRLGQGCLMDLLARLFTAIRAQQSMPHAFAAGLVCPVPKSGDASVPSNYRPITLLNTDYRLLARVLSARVRDMVGQAMGPEQSAFLPKRLIGDNIHFLQLLPAALRANKSWAVLAFLDFAKAFDTIDRQFLCDAMHAVGAGEVVPWVQVMLSDCQACVVLPGAASRPAVWAAGVRQGCPLSPVLYLFVAWALSCWLQSQPAAVVGVALGATRHVSSHFADDTEAVLPSLDEQQVRAFLDCMATFAAATGQRLNTSKCVLVPVGQVPPGVSAVTQVCGVPVRAQASALGVSIPCDDSRTTSRPALAVWQERLAKVHRAYVKVSRLHLSAMGRGLAASCYGVSKLLFHAEFHGLPPPEVAAQLDSLSRQLVDGGLPPAEPGQPAQRRHPGVPLRLLSGSPSVGGFGLLPWKAHIQARHAFWACRLLSFLASHGAGVQPEQERRRQQLDRQLRHGTISPAARKRMRLVDLARQRPPAWMHLAHLLLVAAAPTHHPAFYLLSLSAAPAALPEAHLPAALRRMVAALRALGPPVDVCPPSRPLRLGNWAWCIPLHGNPFMHDLTEVLQRPQARAFLAQDVDWVQTWVEQGFAEMADHPALLNVGCLHDLIHLLRPFPGERPPTQDMLSDRLGWVGATLRASFAGYLRLRSYPADLRAGLLAMWCCVPAAWRTHVMDMGVPPLVNLQRTAVAALVDRLGWRLPGGGVVPVLEGGTVKRLTMLLSRDVHAARLTAWGAFVGDALGGPWVLSPPSLPLPPPEQLPRPQPQPPQQQQQQPRQYLPQGGWVHDGPCHHCQQDQGAHGVGGACPGGPQPDVQQQQQQQQQRRQLPVLPQPEPTVSALPGRFRTLWRLPWHNQHKDVFWRLAVNGVPGMGSHGVCGRRSCPCGWQPPPGLPEQARAPLLRQHGFWSCPVAVGVVAAVRAALPAQVPLHMHHVWLAVSPAPLVVQQEVWLVVAVAALAAMVHGRRVLWAQVLGEEEPAPAERQPTLYELWGLEPEVQGPAALPFPEQAARAAVGRFWCLLQEFVEMHATGVRAWPPGGVVLGPAHPFIAEPADPAAARLVLRVPPA